MAQTGSSEDVRSGKRFVYMVACVAALGGLLFGYDIGIISGALLFIENDFPLTPFLTGVVVSSILLGAVIGAGVSGALGDRLGRRKMILIAAVIFAAGAVGMAFSPTVGILIFFRIVTGLAVGAASALVPTYISEISPTDLRGSLSSVFQLAITLGIMLAYIVNFALSSAEAWRWMLGLAAIPAVILFVGMYLVPETPRWLIKNEFMDDARAVLRRSRGRQDVDDEIEEIQKVERAEGETGLRELISPWVRPMLIVGLGLAMLQQFSGINTIIYYAPTIINNTGFGASASILATVGIGVVNVLFTLVAIWLIDKVGRKKLLLGGLTGMTLGTFLLGLGFLLPSLSGAVSWITLGAMLLFIASFAASFGPIVWVMLPEIFPLHVRGSGVGVSSLSNWVANFIVALSFPILIAAIGQTPVFWGLGVICILSMVFVYFVVPETMGRSLEEIEEDLHQGALAKS
ncbi:MAG TPA: sugar porter family MFS transporter [Rubrobacteraceae bacterium]|nr:sugar porter family MFS transporter [Rubrobacteraceae bacterium]